jgi:hypothetical protein
MMKDVIHLDERRVAMLQSSIHLYGFGHLDGVIAPTVLKKMQEEATGLYDSARFARQSSSLAYSARMTSLGPVAQEFLSGVALLNLLRAMFGHGYALTRDRSCLTFYGPEDHLGPHLDKPADECVVTIIVYLTATRSRAKSRSDETGLKLRIFGETLAENAEPILTIPTVTGAIVLGHGSKVWHERPRLQQGENVVALTGCYRSLIGSTTGEAIVQAPENN